MKTNSDQIRIATILKYLHAMEVSNEPISPKMIRDIINLDEHKLMQIVTKL